MMFDRCFRKETLIERFKMKRNDSLKHLLQKKNEREMKVNQGTGKVGKKSSPRISGRKRGLLRLKRVIAYRYQDPVEYKGRTAHESF
ncbi:uncharacterized protein [Montipora foliosa]|uniref:uncharacterized protein isoform X3 n=1 Tax=Montipora foliosa TaxID=591990 RepID=UPI0035F1F2B2